MSRLVLAAAAALLAVSTVASAEEKRAQQAPFAPEQRVAAAGIVAPAGAATAHANFDHPAIAARRVRAGQAVDPNTYLVQPPAHVEWRVQSVAR